MSRRVGFDFIAISSVKTPFKVTIIEGSRLGDGKAVFSYLVATLHAF